LAFEALVENNYMFVYKVAFKWCGNKEDAEDITQDVFLKLAGKIQEFRESASFKTWLYRIVINAAKDFFKKNKRKQEKESAFLEHERLNAKESSKETTLGEKLYSLIDNLPLKQKEAALLVFSEGLSHKEAADVLNCAETTISWRVFQVRKRFKKYLDRGGYTL